MNDQSPAFGQADLTNCERELIHLAGSVQPHGLLLTLQEPALTVLQASANVAGLLGAQPGDLLGRSLRELGAEVDATVRELARDPQLGELAPLRTTLTVRGTPQVFEGSLHRVPGQGLVVELEPEPGEPVSADLDGALARALQRFNGAATVGTLADAVVRVFRDLTGYDRVMVYQFDPDGHGKVIAEARDPRLESLLGHHYPSTDIPQRARELYLRNRVRVLVDVDAPAAPLQPARLPEGAELDMSMCSLRSMSPLHLQYLRNMGVTATLVVSLVREGRLWGLVACHHYAARRLPYALRAASDLLAEVIATRLAAIENYAYAQVAIQVRRLEQRLIEATSTEGDWRLALLRNPRTLLQPLDASGAVLFHDDEVLTTGEVPSTPQLRALRDWIETRPREDLFACSAVEQANPALSALTPTASGVIAVRLSNHRPDYLMWLRKEQLMSVTWAGNPGKPMIDDDPLQLSPRRSFAAWSEMVRGTAAPWTGGELALARAIGTALNDIIVQVNAVRLLIAEHQLARLRATVGGANEAVIVADADHRTLFANEAFHRLTGRDARALPDLDALAACFVEADAARRRLATLGNDGRSWRAELTLALEPPVPVALRVEVVPARDGTVLGHILVLENLTATRRAAQAREHLEQALARARPLATAAGQDELGSAILANASLAAMDIADGPSAPSVVPVLEELEASTQRATLLYERIRRFRRGR
ncbi:GAF domain-containing protein [Piscinibacter defluvii]|uniref:GAF domain-containing protein n=1 Tax=Piscinibacter defluvii TaxID=1796922 RepID=UPI000FDCE684|nr:GAF domain-containing protein [Piscinibacter defluvii]